MRGIEPLTLLVAPISGKLIDLALRYHLVRVASPLRGSSSLLHEPRVCALHALRLEASHTLTSSGGSTPLAFFSDTLLAEGHIPDLIGDVGWPTTDVSRILLGPGEDGGNLPASHGVSPVVLAGRAVALDEHRAVEADLFGLLELGLLRLQPCHKLWIPLTTQPLFRLGPIAQLELI